MEINQRNDDFDNTIAAIFPNASVLKPLTRKNKIPGVPQRIWEYFVMRYVKWDSNEKEQMEQLDNMLENARKLIPEPGSTNHTLDTIRNMGRAQIIDAISVDICPRTMENYVTSHHFGTGHNIAISAGIINNNNRMLHRPVWGIVTYTWNGNQIEIDQFDEIQNTNVRVEEFALSRQQFSMDEWIKLLVRTVGLNDEWLDDEGRWHIITRLLPLVEPRLHMMEPGPKETGKSTTYMNLDNRVSFVTGLDVTTAKLIYDGLRNIPGILVQYTDGLVVFDETQNGRDRRNVAELAGQLKQVMESGRVERLNYQAETDASVVYIGNTHPNGDVMQQLLPLPFREPAFLSRIAGLLDGHQMPTLERSDISLAQGMGLTCDYFSEVIQQLRMVPTSNELLERIKVENASTRDELAIRRMVSAYLKILHPDGNASEPALLGLAERALKMRQPIVDAAAKNEGTIPRQLKISIREKRR